MGHHYVPKRYLRNFESAAKPRSIWMFEKNGSDPCQAAIRAVAQERSYYDNRIEHQLAEEVERPGNAVIKKLLTGTSISALERFHLAFYIGVMLKRVPDRRQRALALLPSLVRDTKNAAYQRLIAMAEKSGAAPEVLERRLSEADKLVEKFAIEPPPEVVDQIRTPWPTEKMLEALFDMTWRVMIATGPIFYITTDNPAFFFRCWGLGTANSELTFPLSTSHALHGSFKGVSGELLYMEARPSFVRKQTVDSQAKRLALPSITKTQIGFSRCCRSAIRTSAGFPGNGERNIACVIYLARCQPLRQPLRQSARS